MSLCRDRKHARTRRAATARRAVLLALGLGAAGVAVAGCSQQQQPAAPQPKPMDIDAAMQRRDWERSVAWYPNGDVVAGVNRFPLRTYGSTDGGPDLQNALLDFGAAVVQTVALPFTYLVVPPFEKQVFTGDVLPPSYT